MKKNTFIVNVLFDFLLTPSKLLARLFPLTDLQCIYLNPNWQLGGEREPGRTRDLQTLRFHSTTGAIHATNTGKCHVLYFLTIN